MRFSGVLAVALGSVLFAGAVAATQEHRKSFLDQEPPELFVAENGWVNWEGELSLEKLRGHVVWLEFSFLK